ncbi:MAG: LPXTG cell wall anchor domain-containing protein [Ruminiclostridium sp.]|jgi:LPXTG-motif cell wall-anchored protein|nr:LPXTG cell wall anchor domain-containing protein [Ruminiclostridium sp.]
MKSLKKVAPIMATGLVVAGFGTVDAFAADTVDTPAPPAPPAEVEKQAAPAPSTEIKSVTPTSTETAPDGETKTQGAVNLSVNDGGDVTSDGSVTLTTIPDSNAPKAAAPTSEEAGDVTIENTDTTTTTDSDTTIGDIDEIKPTEPGNDITTTTPNPDGSTTTEIEGGVTAPGTPSDVDKDEVENNISDIVDKNKNENGSYGWDVIETEIKNKYDDAKVESSEGTHTITFTQQSESTDAKLTDSELSIILGGVSLTKTGENTYTYTDKDGKTVTVTVTDDSSTETTTTKWTVTVTETDAGTNEEDVTIDEPVWDITDNEDLETDLSVKDILENLDMNKAELQWDENGNGTLTVQNGPDTYTITCTEKTEAGAIDLSASLETIYNLFFADNAGFTFTDGKIFKNGYEVTLKNENGSFTATYYDITITKTTTGESTDNRDTVAQAVKTEAAKKAVVEALNKALDLTGGNKLTYDTLKDEITVNLDDNTWSVTIDNKDYNGIFSDVKATVGGTEVDIDNPNIPLTDGSTINGSANATVEIEVDLDASSGSDTLTNLGISKTDVTDAKDGNLFGNTGETVTYIDETDGQKTIKTTITDDKTGITTIKTYTFTFEKEWEYGDTADEKYIEIGKDTNGFNSITITGDNFFIKQGTYGIIWVANKDDRSDEQIKRTYWESFHGTKPIGDKWKVVEGNGTFLFSDFWRGEENLDGRGFIVEDGVLTPLVDYSHVDMAPGDEGHWNIAIDENGEWTATGTQNKTGTGSGDATGEVAVTPGTLEEVTSSASGVQYGGTLDYSYTTTQPGIEITVSGETEKHRDINVSLNSTPTTPTTPTTPPGGGGGTPTTPPGGGGGTTTPTPPPVVDIPEEEPPLVDIPEEEPPLVDIPEEEPPLVDIPEEEPPLVDIPEEQPPLVDIPNTQPPKVTIPAEKVPLVKAPDPSTIEILEEEVPLADVPNTGDTPMGLLAAAAACLSTLGLGILKKRED